MKIITLIKQVPETDSLVFDEETGTVKREGASSIVNPLDLYAIETALALKERAGSCEITAVTMGPPSAEKALREALSMGVDEAVLLTDRNFAGSDTYATSLVLSRAVEYLGGADLVICGEKATDGDTAQVGPETAAFLGIPVASFVSSAVMSDGKLMIERMIETGIESYSCRLPLLVTVVKAAGEPRLPTLQGKRRAAGKEIKVLGAADLGIGQNLAGLHGSPTRVHRVHRPSLKRKSKQYRAVKDTEIEEAVISLIQFLEERQFISGADANE